MYEKKPWNNMQNFERRREENYRVNIIYMYKIIKILKKINKFKENVYFMVDIRGNLCYYNHVSGFVTIL